MGKDQELLDAARNGNIIGVQKVLEHIMKRSIGPLSSFRRGPNINAQDMNGYTPLHHACLNGHSNIVRLLLSHGAIPDVPDIRSSTPLYLAAWAGHGDIMKMLLFHSDKPANPNAQTIENDTPLHCAAQHGHNTALSILLAYGADPTIRNNSFQTALDLAAQFGRLQAVQILIRTHPELIAPYRLPNAINAASDGHSPPYERTTPTKHIFTHTCLHLASRNGHKKVVENLLTAGVDVNILTHSGSALHEAALCGKKSVVVVLLKAGIDPHATDGSGHTALDILKEFPPHVTYEIVSVINDFCHRKKSDSPFRPIKDEHQNLKDFEPNAMDLRGKSDSLPKSSYKHMCLNPTKRDATQPMNIQSDSTQSLEQCAKPSGFYLKMKPIKWQQYKNETRQPLETVFAYKPTCIRNGQSDEIKPNGHEVNAEKTHARSPKSSVSAAKTALNSTANTNAAPPPYYPCVDGYVKMTKPNNGSSCTPSTTKPKAPIPSPRNYECGDYENMNLIVSPSSKSLKYARVTALRANAKAIDANNNSNNKEHSPTPECAPPSFAQAEDAIFEFIQPLSAKSKRKSIRLQNDDELDLEHFVFEGLSAEDSADTPSSRASDYVEEYIGDVPFAGLFKGSTFTLNIDNDNDRAERSNPLEEQPSGLRSPSLVKAVKPVPAKRKLSTPKISSSVEDLNVSKVWAEIDTILESIGNEVSTAELFTPNTDAVSSAVVATTSRQEATPNCIQIRNPSELVLDASGKTPENSAAKWCHSSDALIFGEIIYNVYYLGSTVIRVLRGTLSTRKSIQKLKRGETPIFEEESEENLLEDCNSFTKILKANNQQTRLQVGIAFSHVGVKFMDSATKSTICTHDIQNINCVCQDNEDLRYFAYITKENDLHYCHVFTVDSLELATEIILTLGQAFEVAYQLALRQRQEVSFEQYTNNSNQCNV